MKCLRCGYCCTTYLVVIVDDPEKGIAEDNIVVQNGEHRCKHLQGDAVGVYSCALHDYPWYKETPCFDYGQIETSSDTECRMGRFILDGGLENGKKKKKTEKKRFS